jgi:protein-tyrosine phosphatase
MAEPTRILFVCLGNIVRSPLAEHLFRRAAQEAGVADKYEVASAGTAAYHVGDSPDARMRQVAANRGFIYDGRGRHVKAQDLKDFDLVVPMDSSNKEDLLLLAQRPEQVAKIRLLREFDPEADGEFSVPDPYYGGLQGFENVYDMIDRSVQRLLASLEAGEVPLP